MIVLRSVFLIIMTQLAFTASAISSARTRKKPKNAFFLRMEIPGEVTQPGTTNTENDMIFLLDLVQQSQDKTDDNRAQGNLTIEANA